MIAATHKGETEAKPKYPPQTSKRYRCTQCGHETNHTTNHYGATWSWGRVSACPTCPPFRKFPEYGGQTIWECLETED